MQVTRAESFSSLPGAGVKGIVDGEIAYGGKPKAFDGILTLKEEWLSKGGEYSDEGKTPLYFAKGGQAIGIIAVADTLKEDSCKAISDFKAMGLIPVMLTGDNRRTASYIASKVGVTYFKSDVTPDGKLSLINELKKKGKVMMVGDGINDAPSLTSADVGLAIGAGSDIAIDSADVVLMKGSLLDACAAIRLSRLTLLNIKENLFWAFFYNLIMIPVAAGCFSALGLAKLKPWYGAAAMALSSLCVVLNALRINLYHLYKPSHKRKRVDDDKGLEALFEESNKGENKTMNKELKIKGMMCQHCVAHVKSALEGVDGVASVSVSLEEGKAFVSLGKEVSDEVLIDAVKKAGYEAKSL